MSDSNQGVDLFGWDTAFAVRLANLNEEIVKQKKWPAGFTINWPKFQASCSASFDPWQLCPGGDGEQVVMILPLKNVNFHYAGLAQEIIKGKNLTATAKVQVRMNFIPSANKNALVVNPNKYEGTDPFTILSVSIAGQKKSSKQENGIKTFLNYWLQNNLAAFAHIFALVDLNRTADKAQFQWMQPTAQEYAYTDIGDDDGALGVICMTSGRDAGDLAQQISSYLIPDGASSALGISKERMLSNLFLPMLPQVFFGTKIDDFSVDLDTNAITLAANKTPDFKSFSTMFYKETEKVKPLETEWHKVESAINQSGTLKSKAVMKLVKNLYDKLGIAHKYTLLDFSLNIQGQEVIFHAKCNAKNPDFMPGVTAYCSVTRRMKAQVSSGSDGNGIKFVEVGEPVTNHSIKVSGGVVIAEIMTAMTILVIGVAIAFLTGGAAILALLSVTVALAGAIPAGVKLMEMAAEDNAPALKLAAADASAPIKWSDEKDFKLNKVELKESLLLIGQLLPSSAKST